MDRNTKIRLSTIALAVSGALAFIGCGGGSSSTPVASGPTADQKAVSEKIKTLKNVNPDEKTIEKDGLTFRDLNGNGKLDDNEDYRKPAADRAAALLDAMSPSAGKTADTSQDEAKVKQLIGLVNVFNVYIANGNFCKDGTNPSFDGKKYDLVCEKQGITYWPFPGGVPSKSTSEMMQAGARYFTIRDNPSAADLAKWTNNLQKLAAKTQWGIPVVITSNPRNHIAAGGGFAEASGVYSFWPNMPGLAAAALGEKVAKGSQTLIRDFASEAAKEWVATGVRKGYMYQADLATEPRWERNNGTFGDDPDLVAEIMQQLTEGFQGTKAGDFVLKPTSVALTTKHFPGNGVAPNGIDSHGSAGNHAMYSTPGSLAWQVKAFQGAIDAGTSSIMTYYQIPSGNIAQQLPAKYLVGGGVEEVGTGFNKSMLSYLKGDKADGGLGFKGYINSDSRITIREGQPHGVENLSAEDRIAKSFNAGMELLSIGHGEHNMVTGKAPIWADEEMFKAYKAGKISLEIIKKAAKPLLTEMFQMGLFDNPYVDESKVASIVSTEALKAKAALAHQKSVVLLKNDNVLPLKVDDAAVKLYVEVFAKAEDNADPAKQNSRTKAMRAWVKSHYPNAQVVEDHAQATHAILMVSPSSVTICEKAGGGEEICASTLGKSTAEAQAIEDSKRHQEIRINAFSAGTKTSKIAEIQDAMVAAGKPVIVVVNMGNPWLIDGIEPKAKAMITTYDTTNDALFDVITGKFNPTGRLPIAIPRNWEEVQKNAADTPGHMEKSATYAYKDALGKVYTFGYGLSYPIK